MKSFSGRDQLTSKSISDKKERVKTLSNWRNEARKKGGKEEREKHKRGSQKYLTNRIPEDTKRLGPPFPTKNTGLITSEPLEKNLEEEENLERERWKKEMARGEGDWGSLILI